MQPRVPERWQRWLRQRIKPHVLLLADRRDWAFDIEAQAMQRHLSDAFNIQIAYVSEKPDLDALCFDTLYVFSWGTQYHQKFGIERQRVIKSLTSERWAREERYGLLTPEQFVQRDLADAGTIVATSRRLERLVAPHYPDAIFWAPNGIDPEQFYNRHQRSGPLRIGWAGNPDDPKKGLPDILFPAAGDDFEIYMASKNYAHHEMIDFYNTIDVICVAATEEGTPLPLIEAMACGCFPICVDVGVVSEIVQHEQNGLIIERTSGAFRAAFEWCAAHTEEVRAIGASNATYIARTRNWHSVLQLRKLALWHALRQVGWQPHRGLWHCFRKRAAYWNEHDFQPWQQHMRATLRIRTRLRRGLAYLKQKVVS
jgi:glycosyltransferase involved in cell wall biosynthesis